MAFTGWGADLVTFLLLINIMFTFQRSLIDVMAQHNCDKLTLKNKISWKP
jgi:hypothetical protein